jgi:GT2 family glycosyltransferase
MGIAIAVLTHNRVHLLRQCVENVLSRASEVASEVVIWDNGSSDGTPEYLDSLTDPRFDVVCHPENIGPSAYDLAFARTTSEYLVELDDDVIDAPPRWDELLLRSLERLPPDFGLLSANLVDNPNDTAARAMYTRNAHLYRIEEVNGIRLKVGGPVGGGCAIIPRAVYDRVGGFGRNKRLAYWSSDAVFLTKLHAAGLRVAYLDDLRVLHAGGEYYAPISADKWRFYKARYRRLQRRDAVKRALLRVPFVAHLNERFGWFYPPGSDWAPTKRRMGPGGL